MEAPAALRTAARLRRAWSVWASIPSGMDPDSGSIPAVPEQKTKPPATMAWLYGPRAAGACSVEICVPIHVLSLPLCDDASAGRYSAHVSGESLTPRWAPRLRGPITSTADRNMPQTLESPTPNLVRAPGQPSS